MKMPKPKRKEAGFFLQRERQKRQRLYTKSVCAHGSMRNLVEASILPVAKVRQFLHSKPSFTEFTFAAPKFKRMKAFARLTNIIWSEDMGYVDKEAKDIHVKSLY